MKTEMTSNDEVGQWHQGHGGGIIEHLVDMKRQCGDEEMMSSPDMVEETLHETWVQHEQKGVFLKAEHDLVLLE